MQSYQYVILRHEGIDDPHFDIMLEEEPGGSLMTWRSDRWPITEKTPLRKLDNHRREYLTYEGPISGNRGHVRRVESGTYRRWPDMFEPYALELWFNEPVTWHLYLLCPPDYEWALEPAET